MLTALRHEIAEYAGLCRDLRLGRRDAGAVICLSLVATLLEGIGLGAFLPLLQVLTAGAGEAMPGAGKVMDFVSRGLAFFGLHVGLESLIACIVLLLLLRQAFIFLRSAVLTFISERIKRDIRDRLFDGLVHSELSCIDRNGGGALINAFTNEAQIAASAIMAPIGIVNQSVIGIIFLVMMLMISVNMTWLSIVVLCFSVLILVKIISVSRKSGRELALTNNLIVDFLASRMSALRLLRLSGTEDIEVGKMRDLSRRIYSTNVRIGYLGSSLNVLMEPVVVACGLVILYLGIRVLDMPTAEAGFFILILMRLQPASKDALKLYQQYVTGVASSRSLAGRLREFERFREQRTGAAPVPALRRGIAFEGVDFDYPDVMGRGASAALRGIDLELRAGDWTALVGPSGAGKSTLIDLLPRLRRPTRGRVLIDGVPLDEIETVALRAAIAFVPQAPVILGDTPRQHIGYGAGDLSEEAMVTAARMAGAHEFIARLAQGYDTPLGAGGGFLSGGERQRLDLARALARGAAILILDEPSSNLDAESEAWLRETLARIRAQRMLTIVMIAHQLSTVAQADRIVVLSAGRVEAVGTHEDLRRRSPWYASAWARQSEPYGSDEVAGALPPARHAV